MKFLLDYFFPITAIAQTPQASTAFLKQACLVVKPKMGVSSGEFGACTSMQQVALLTENEEAEQLFAAGMNLVYILVIDDLDVKTALEEDGNGTNFYTLLISSDFVDADVTNDLDLGDWKGVLGLSSTDDGFLKTQGAIENRCAFHTTATNKAQNMLYAFGKLLSNRLAWNNQQYISMPLADDVDSLGAANVLFDDKISFVISDAEFGNRLGLFTAGGKAIIAPYVTRNLEIDLQSRALSYVSGNQPGYTLTQAALLQDELQKVIDLYISRQWIELGQIDIKLEQQNFVASGYINISEPNALWRIFGELRQTL